MEDTVSRELALSTPHFSTPVSSPLVGSKLLLQKPILVGVFHPPYWLFLFINNAASVVLLSLIPPRASRCFSWWLSPTDHDGKRDLAGTALVIGLYALWMLVFWLYQTRFGLPW